MSIATAGTPVSMSQYPYSSLRSNVMDLPLAEYEWMSLFIEGISENPNHSYQTFMELSQEAQVRQWEIQQDGLKRAAIVRASKK